MNVPGSVSTIAAEVARSFHARFGAPAKLTRAPGRVNLIGEHTDYNQGYVLPAAIDLSCWVASSPRADNKLVVYSENANEQIEAPLTAPLDWRGPTWARYPVGVAWALQQAGHVIPGANLYIRGDVPLGSGLSSSAAIEVATALALLSASDAAIDRTKLALLCQRAENEFVGALCGIMDQFISCRGEAGHALLLDCRFLEFRAVPVPKSLALVIVNSMVKHNISAASGYNTRRQECDEAMQRLKKFIPSLASLRDLTSDQLEDHHDELPDVIYRRCRHVVTENARVLAMVNALEHHSLQDIAKNMAASHKSLRDDYEVSCPEVDTLVEIATPLPAVFGARMMGGGFGGCTINLVRHEHAESFLSTIRAEYQKRTGIQPDAYIFQASAGAELLPVK